MIDEEWVILDVCIGCNEPFYVVKDLKNEVH